MREKVSNLRFPLAFPVPKFDVQEDLFDGGKAGESQEEAQSSSHAGNDRVQVVDVILTVESLNRGGKIDVDDQTAAIFRHYGHRAS